MDKCPKCDGKEIRRCRCTRCHRECENGHHWHTCRVHKKTVFTEHSEHINKPGCTCRPEGERENLISELKRLYAVSRAKQEELQTKHGTGPAVGFITKETFKIAALIPKMRYLGIILDDLEEKEQGD